MHIYDFDRGRDIDIGMEEGRGGASVTAAADCDVALYTTKNVRLKKN